jgi:hypothetical protein
VIPREACCESGRSTSSMQQLTNGCFLPSPCPSVQEVLSTLRGSRMFLSSILLDYASPILSSGIFPLTVGLGFRPKVPPDSVMMPTQAMTRHGPQLAQQMLSRADTLTMLASSQQRKCWRVGSIGLCFSVTPPCQMGTFVVTLQAPGGLRHSTTSTTTSSRDISWVRPLR